MEHGLLVRSTQEARLSLAKSKELTFASSQVQRSVAIGVLHINVGIGRQQSLHHALVAAACCIVQSSRAIRGLHADHSNSVKAW
jgi:hypothetical protein